LGSNLAIESANAIGTMTNFEDIRSLADSAAVLPPTSGFFGGRRELLS
jgi:hypothetical protein